MAWENPKTNWSAADGVRNTDFNRIEGNILELYNSTYPQSNVTIYVATTGNDTTGTGSQLAPYRTITKALSVAPKHTNGKLIMIYIGAGTYSESIIISGFTNPITLTGAASSNVTITSMRIDHCKCLISNINLTASQGVTLMQGGIFA